MNVSLEKAKSVKEKEVKLYNCPFCDKTFKSSPGLKGHITKMHPKSKQSSESVNKKESIEIDLHEEANKVVNLLLKEIVVISEDEESLDDVTLEEIGHPQVGNKEKKYINVCELCGFEAVATRRYNAIRQLSKHKETCQNGACIKCDFHVKDKITLKRHMRDQHEVVTCSTSPPLKRKRRSKLIEDKVQIMDVEEDNLVDLSVSLEEMEIDDKEEGIFKERTRLMDEKVKEKARKTEEEELILMKKTEDALEKKKKVAAKKMETAQSLKKRNKQKVKDLKKSSKKKEKATSDAIKVRIPNLKEVPANCKHLVDVDDMVYVVPGDGCCGPNCGAAFLFEDEVYGPKLRLQMNRFMAEHWYSKYQYITNCSDDSPFIRKYRGGEHKYTNPDELLKFLKESEEAAYMWTDCEDLAVLADLYQIRIKIITTKGPDDQMFQQPGFILMKS